MHNSTLDHSISKRLVSLGPWPSDLSFNFECFHAAAVITMAPTSQITLLGERPQFFCEADGGTPRWVINQVPYDHTFHPDRGIARRAFQVMGSVRQTTLEVHATVDNNNTELRCQVSEQVQSAPILLQVQGMQKHLIAWSLRDLRMHKGQRSINFVLYINFEHRFPGHPTQPDHHSPQQYCSTLDMGCTFHTRPAETPILLPIT